MTLLHRIPTEPTAPKGVHSPRVEATVERAIAESALTGQAVTLLCGPESVRDAALCAALEARRHEDWILYDGRFVRTATGRHKEREWRLNVVETRPTGKTREDVLTDVLTAPWYYWAFFAGLIALTFTL